MGTEVDTLSTKIEEDAGAVPSDININQAVTDTGHLDREVPLATGLLQLAPAAQDDADQLASDMRVLADSAAANGSDLQSDASGAISGVQQLDNDTMRACS